MKYLLLIALLFPTIAFSQQSNRPFKKTNKLQVYTRDSIQNRLTTKSKTEIEKLLVGKWRFIKATEPDGRAIDTIYAGSIHDKTLNIPSAISKPNYNFKESLDYQQINIDSVSTGKFYYDDKHLALRLVFDNPYDPYLSFDEKTRAVFDQLKKRPAVDTEEWLNIHKLNKNELILIQVCKSVCITITTLFTIKNKRPPLCGSLSYSVIPIT